MSTDQLTQTETPVVDSTPGGKPGLSLSSLLDGPETKGPDSPTPASDTTKADGEPNAPGVTEKPAVKTEEPKPAAPKTTPKTETPEAPPVEDGETVVLTKKELANREFKWREKARKVREEKEAIAKKLAEYEGTPEPSTTPDPVQEAVMKERVKTSQAAFVRHHGQEALDALLKDDESGWLKIESEANAGDEAAKALWQRALQADDPYEEIRVIVGERQLYEQYGTTRLPDLIAKVRSEAQAQAERAVNEHLNPKKQAKTGQIPHGLGDAPSSGRDSPASMTEQPTKSLAALLD